MTYSNTLTVLQKRYPNGAPAGLNLEDLAQLIYMLSEDGVRFKKRHAKKIARMLKDSEFAQDEVK